MRAEVGVQAQPLVDGLKPGRVDADAVHVVAELPGEFGDPVVSLSQRRRQGVHLGTYGGKPADQRGRLPDQSGRVGDRPVALEQLRRQAQIALYVLGVREDPLLGLKRCFVLERQLGGRQSRTI